MKAYIVKNQTPILFSGVFWLFDSLTSFFGYHAIAPTLLMVLFPPLLSLDFIFRFSMAIAIWWGSKLIMEYLSKAKTLKHQLFLSEYAVENTQAFAMFWIDSTGRITKVNKKACELLGYTKKELLNLTTKDVATRYTEEGISWSEHWANLKEKKSITIKTNFVCRDKTLKPAVVHIQYLKVAGTEYDFGFACEALTCPFSNVKTNCEESK